MAANALAGRPWFLEAGRLGTNCTGCPLYLPRYKILHIYRKILRALLMAAVALAGVVAYATPATAQSYNYGNPGVANVSVANGSVVIVRGDSGAQVAATVNAPLVPGDYIATGSGSNAEVQLD